MKLKAIIGSVFLTIQALCYAQNNVAEEVAWVVGDEPIFKSEIEEQYKQLQYDRTDLKGNPYCVIPERMALEKLFLHQAKIDSVEVQESRIVAAAESRINFFIANLGKKEKVEEYFRKPMPDIREQMIEVIRNQFIVQEVQMNLTKNVKATPNDVRKYYNSLPEDSLPFIPKQVEVQIVTLNPKIPQQEIDDVKSRLRDYAQRVNNGESEFSTLAILYSEDGSSVYGGEIGFMGKAELMPEYANVAFNLNDTKKVSKIVETEAGFHIIQLIEKRGDRANTRHILIRPKVSQKDLDAAVLRLDSIRADILDNKFTFEEAAQYISQDKDSKNNRGLLLNPKNGTTKYEMADLPPEIGKMVNEMEVGEVSKAFIMKNRASGRDMVAIVKLTSRKEGHKADLADDFQVLKNMYEENKRTKIIEDWVKKKRKETIVRIEDGWRDCEFEYDWFEK